MRTYTLRHTCRVHLALTQLDWGSLSSLLSLLLEGVGKVLGEPVDMISWLKDGALYIRGSVIGDWELIRFCEDAMSL